jgi:hypothetical protein
LIKFILFTFLVVSPQLAKPSNIDEIIKQADENGLLVLQDPQLQKFNQELWERLFIKIRENSAIKEIQIPIENFRSHLTESFDQIGFKFLCSIWPNSIYKRTQTTLSQNVF